MRDHRRHWGGLAAALAAFWLGAGGGPVLADEARAPATESDDASRGTAVTVAGLRVFIDPETGRLRPPTDAEAAALSRAMVRAYADRPTENAPAVHHADGSVTMQLGTRHLMHNMARLNADGEVETFCVQGADAAAEVLAETPATDDAGEATP